MKKEEIKIIDESGDKKYFTIIPNYILNHSTLWDREVYIQMKRIAGENGTCWTARQTLAKQCGISIRRLDKSITYLIAHKWLEKIGTKKIGTKGGEQEVNEYKIADLWKLNIDYYESLKGGAPNALPTNKGYARKDQRVCTDEAKGGAPGAHKEEPHEEEPLNKSVTQSVTTPSQESENFFKNEEMQKKAIDYLTTKGFNQEFTRNEINKFISYWTEPTRSGKKQRWETEKTYDVRRRLATWLNNSNKFNRSTLSTTKRGIEV